MRKAFIFFGQTFVFYSIFLIILSTQGAVWLQLFTHIPEISTLSIFLVFIVFYRNLIETIISTYLLTFVAVPFYDLPPGLLLCCTSLLSVALLSLKSRFLVTQSTHLGLITVGASLFFHFLHFFTSYFIESNFIKSFNIFNWVISSLITAIISIGIFQLLIFIDRITEKSLPTEVRYR